MGRSKIEIEQPNLFALGTPSMPVLDTSRCYAKVINYETAANMVETYHYAHRVPSIVVAVGMYVDDVLAGCATCGVPPNYRAVDSVCGITHNGLEFNRLFVHDWAPHNSESWLIGQLIHIVPHLRPDCEILISYADPNQGHKGYVYQATNWLYLGQGTPESGSPDSDMILDGSIISFKQVYNLYGTHSVKKLQAMGFDAEPIHVEPKHRYVYFLGSKRQRKALLKALKWPVLPYPKASTIQTESEQL